MRLFALVCQKCALAELAAGTSFPKLQTYCNFSGCGGAQQRHTIVGGLSSAQLAELLPTLESRPSPGPGAAPRLSVKNALAARYLLQRAAAGLIQADATFHNLSPLARTGFQMATGLSLDGVRSNLNRWRVSASHVARELDRELIPADIANFDATGYFGGQEVR